MSQKIRVTMGRVGDRTQRLEHVAYLFWDVFLAMDRSDTVGAGGSGVDGK